MRNILRIITLTIIVTFFQGVVFCHDSTRPEGDAKKGGIAPATSDLCKLRISLIEEKSGESIPGMIRLLDESGVPVRIPGLLDRCIGLPGDARKLGWHVLIDSSEISVPRQKLTVEGVSGLEHTGVRQSIDLTDRSESTCELKSTRFWKAGERGLVAGNTHLHLKDLSLEEANQYLKQVSRADGLEVVFVSYLERAIVDRTYITNQLSRSDLEGLSFKHVHFGNGQEYRHNFGGGGEGYGHVMFLDLEKLILPGSIGPGITNAGTDGTALREGIREANDQKATVVWCHNQFGFEDIPSWVSGLVQAQNIFDGGNQGSYEDTFYRYLNLGIRVPFSSGTDWFIYDYSRVYTEMGSEKLSVSNWLDRFREGRTFITNGPLLELEINGAGPGEEVKADSKVKARFRAVSREDLGTLELVRNGVVIPLSNAKVETHDGWVESKGEIDLPIDKPSWIALRVSPAVTAKNEFGQRLFAHTSPVYVNTTQGEVIEPGIVGELISEVEENLAAIREWGIFDSDDDREKVEQIYQEAISKLRAKLSL